MTLANVKWLVNASAVRGLQRNPLIIYPGYPTLELEGQVAVAFHAFFFFPFFFSCKEILSPSTAAPAATGRLVPVLVCVCAQARHTRM